MNLVHKIGGTAVAHQRASGVNVVLPAVQLLVALEREIYPLVLRLQEQAIGLEVCPFDICDIRERDLALILRRSLDGGHYMSATVPEAE